MKASAGFVRAVVLLTGSIMLALGFWAFFAPRSFAEQIATFPPYNHHLLHDLGAFQIGIGTAVLLTLVWRDRCWSLSAATWREAACTPSRT
jgi:hypothetical protein